jgi:hypothetical protein
MSVNFYQTTWRNNPEEGIIIACASLGKNFIATSKQLT